MPSSLLGTATVLGVGVLFESSFPEALNAALDMFPDRRECCGVVTEASVYIVITTHCDDHAPSEEHRICGKRLHFRNDGVGVEADGERGHAICSFRAEAIGTESFCEAVRTAVLFLVAQRGRVPVHASAVLIGDCAVVLAGRSGSGKSSLALAGNASGLPVLAEDTVFVQSRPAFRIWGSCDHIHVFAKDASCVNTVRVRLRSGRLKHAIPIALARQSADKAVLCVLSSGDNVCLSPLSPESAVCTLTREPEPGYDFYGPRMDEAIRAIAASGCWRLTLARDPNTAIAALVDTFGHGVAHR